MIEGLINLLQNKTQHYPDDSLKNTFAYKSLDNLHGVSQINAEYENRYVQTRTSTIILVDYDDNVEYYELNLTDWSQTNPLLNQTWKMKKIKFKLKPLYKHKSNRSTKLNIKIIL